jgi:polyisoprenoid-binding protein YceI
VTAREILMTIATTATRSATRAEPAAPLGDWRVDPSRSSALFTARLAGNRVVGRLPLAGGAVIAAPIENSVAHLTAMTEAVNTGSALLDRLLTGPGFLDAKVFREISFRTQMLVQVPTGWRAVGQLQLKGVEHTLVCELDPHRYPQPDATTMTLTSRWVIDSTWITTRQVPTLSRRIAMSCSIALEPNL